MLEPSSRRPAGRPGRRSPSRGPCSPASRRARSRRAQPGVAYRTFVPELAGWFGAVDALVCMGGYNTLAEALVRGTPTVCVPRTAPRASSSSAPRRSPAGGCCGCSSPTGSTRRAAGEVESALAALPHGDAAAPRGALASPALLAAAESLLAEAASGLRRRRCDERRPLRYILKMYPRFSETFILNELLELERQGVALRIFSLKEPDDGIVHSDVARVRGEVTYVRLWQDAPAAARAHARVLRSSPLGGTPVHWARRCQRPRLSSVKRFLKAGVIAEAVQREDLAPHPRSLRLHGSLRRPRRPPAHRRSVQHHRAREGHLSRRHRPGPPAHEAERGAVHGHGQRLQPAASRRAGPAGRASASTTGST